MVWLIVFQQVPTILLHQTFTYVSFSKIFLPSPWYMFFHNIADFKKPLLQLHCCCCFFKKNNQIKWHGFDLIFSSIHVCFFCGTFSSVFKNLTFLVSYVRMLTWFQMLDFVLRTTRSGFSTVWSDLQFSLFLYNEIIDPKLVNFGQVFM